MQSWGLAGWQATLHPYLRQHRARPPLCPQHGVSLVPLEEFSMEFVEPQVHCVSSHGTFGPSR